MITCWNCGFGHKTEEELRACNSPHQFSGMQNGLCSACGHGKDTKEHRDWQEENDPVFDPNCIYVGTRRIP